MIALILFMKRKLLIIYIIRIACEITQIGIRSNPFSFIVFYVIILGNYKFSQERLDFAVKMFFVNYNEPCGEL